MTAARWSLLIGLVVLAATATGPAGALATTETATGTGGEAITTENATGANATTLSTASTANATENTTSVIENATDVGDATNATAGTDELEGRDAAEGVETTVDATAETIDTASDRIDAASETVDATRKDADSTDGETSEPTADRPSTSAVEDATGGSAESSADGTESGRPLDAGGPTALGGVAALAVLARRFGALSVVSGAPGAGSLLGRIGAWVWRLLGVAGYKRFDDSDPLEHETRAAIFDHLQAAPGSYLAEISEETGAALSTVRYHLRILEFENQVETASMRGRRRYFPIGTDPNGLDAARNDEATRTILEALAREPDSVSGLADRLDRDPSTVSHHLQRLAEEDLVEREREGRAVINRLPSEVRATLDTNARPAASGD